MWRYFQCPFFLPIFGSSPNHAWYLLPGKVPEISADNCKLEFTAVIIILDSVRGAARVGHAEGGFRVATTDEGVWQRRGAR